MKPLALLCTVALLTTAIASPTFAQAGGNAGNGGRAGRGQGGFGQGQGFGQGARGNFAPANPYANQLALMEANLKLTDDQKTKLKTKTDAMNAELEQFQTTAQESLRGAGRGNAGGRMGRGAQAAAPESLADRVRGLVADYEKLVAKHQAAIDAELTDDQKISWETFKIDHALEPRIALMGLSGDQRTKLKEMTAAAGKSIAQLPDLTDVAALQDIQGKLAKRLMTEVLTDGQASLVLGGAPLPPALQMLNNPGRGNFAGGQNGQGRGNRAGGRGANANATPQGAIGADGMPTTRDNRLP